MVALFTSAKGSKGRRGEEANEEEEGEGETPSSEESKEWRTVYHVGRADAREFGTIIDYAFARSHNSIEESKSVEVDN